MENNKEELVTRKTSRIFVKCYLFVYNFFQFSGWLYLLYQLLDNFTSTPPPLQPLYDQVKVTLFIIQNAAILEVAHAVVRIVPSNPVITLQQVASRVIIVCGVLLPSIASRNTVGFPVMLLAWSTTEIIRYGYYGLNVIGVVPALLVWLRYTTFIVLYPIGVTGELMCLFAAQKEFGETGFWTWTYEIPNVHCCKLHPTSFTFSYRVVLILYMLLYIPLFPQMYWHMVLQRKKTLGKEKEEIR